MLQTIMMLLLFLIPAAWGQGITDPLLFWEQATVYRDEWGVPHVYADNPMALASAFGYAQAEDHAERMLLAYRFANGRAAEVLGEAYADSDAFALQMNHAGLAQEALAAADPLTRDLCIGFAQGVNAWLAEHSAVVPEWADSVRPQDILALLHCYLMSFAPFDLPGAYRPPPAAMSGNAWVLGPPRSQTGETILVINPHTDYDGPFQWYEAHLVTHGWNVAGATLFGLPVILQGHNEVLGWALTPNQPDFADIYVVPETPAPRRNPKEIKQPKATEAREWALSGRENEWTRTFLVRTPAGFQERSVLCSITSWGPVVGRHDGRPAAYQVGGYYDFGALLQLFEMGRARSLAEFQQALSMLQLPCFHVLYGDREGNIFYAYNVKTGSRHEPLEPILPGAKQPPGTAAAIDWCAPLSTGDVRTRWGGVLSPAQLPALTNPPAGYLQACGTPPWGVSDNSTLRAENWPAWLVHDVDTYRARRVRYLLGLGKRSWQETQAMLYDVLASLATDAVPALLEAVEQQPELLQGAHPDVPAALDLLRNWNYVAETTSTGMTLFHVWWAALRGLAMGPPEFVLHGMREGRPEARQAAIRAVGEAVKLMRNEFQSLDVPWGNVHVLTRGAQLIPIAGAMSGEPIFVASDFVFDDRKWRATYGYGFAMVVRFGERPQAVTITPFGASDRPGSPHYADQLPLLAGRQFKTARFEHEDIQRNAESAYGRVIQLRPRGMRAFFSIRAQAPVRVRLRVFEQPPAPLPPGTGSFTPFVAPERLSGAASLMTDMSIHLPAETCPPGSLNQLTVYGYDPVRGWGPLRNQKLDPATRTFQARDADERVYAILGPASFAGAATPAPQATVGPPQPQVLRPQSPPGMPDTPEASPAVPTEESLSGPPASVAQSELPPPTVASRRNVVIGWGADMELLPPGIGGRFHIRAKSSIGARLVLLDEPPALAPAGLVAFTPCIKVECSSSDAIIELTVSLDVPQEVCDRAHLDQLALYAYEPTSGWTTLNGLQRDTVARRFTASDTQPRVYAVLGPEKYLIPPIISQGTG